jgi:hypothetical protein
MTMLAYAIVVTALVVILRLSGYSDESSLTIGLLGGIAVLLGMVSDNLEELKRRDE